MSVLDVLLDGRLVGTLSQVEAGGDYTFAYDAGVAAAAPGALLLSVALPCRPDPFEPAESRPFFEGLLPEGESRRLLARELGVSEGNGFGLLAQVGRDCAGAVVILPPGEQAVADESVEWLSGSELEALVAALPSHPLGIARGDRLRLSLAGVQRKAVLVRRADGVFGRPSAARPSTHILKPQYADSPFDDLVHNEHFCMRVAAAAGLPAAGTELIEIAGRPCLLIERFDRAATAGGPVRRVHQEDCCQALGRLPSAKYQDEGGPDLAGITGMLRQVSTRAGADVLALLRATVLNLILGNADAHGKNFALLHDDGIRLAPLYDIVSTAAYERLDTHLAMAIGETADPDAVGEGDLFDLAEDCGLSYPQLSRDWRRFAATCLTAVERVQDEARAEGWHRPVIDRVVAVAQRRGQRIAACG